MSDPAPEPSRIRYLNTDLDLVSSEDLAPLAAHFQREKIPPLHVTQGEDGLWYAIFETEHSHERPETNLAEILDAIERIPEHLRDAWSRCIKRELNLGFDCGAEPWAYAQDLSSELLARMGRSRIALGLTLYPERPDPTASTDCD